MKEENKMAVKTKIKDLAIGSEYNAGPATLRILDHFTDGTTLLLEMEDTNDNKGA